MFLIFFKSKNQFFYRKFLDLTKLYCSDFFKNKKCQHHSKTLAVPMLKSLQNIYHQKGTATMSPILTKLYLQQKSQ